MTTPTYTPHHDHTVAGLIFWLCVLFSPVLFGIISRPYFKAKEKRDGERKRQETERLRREDIIAMKRALSIDIDNPSDEFLALFRIHEQMQESRRRMRMQKIEDEWARREALAEELIHKDQS